VLQVLQQQLLTLALALPLSLTSVSLEETLELLEQRVLQVLLEPLQRLL
jgi:hypothetical protein